jgi:hypothetical protein
LPHNRQETGPIIEEFYWMRFRVAILCFFAFLLQSGLCQSQSELQVLLSACQFLAGSPLNGAEQRTVIQDCQNDFARDPAHAASEIAQLRQLGSALSQVSNPLQLVAVRQQALFAVYQDYAGGSPSPTSQVVLARANPLAVDPQNQLLLLPDDLEGATAFLSVLQQMQGGTAMTPAQQNQFKSQVVSNFAGLPSETKELLVCGRVVWAIASQRVAQWNQQQQAQFVQQVAPAQAAQPMSMDTYQMLSNMSRNQHMTTMNILENMGDSGGYWDMVERPSW